MAKLGSLAGSFRERVKDKFSNGADRKAFWEEVFYGPIAEQAYANNLEEAERLLADKLESTDEFKTGEVYLVGGGPGDPDLLTFKALRLMQQADIVLYDRLVSKEVLNLVRRDATRIYVGKTAGDHPVTQDNINQKLVDYALEGNRVVRLKVVARNTSLSTSLPLIIPRSQASRLMRSASAPLVRNPDSNSPKLSNPMRQLAPSNLCQ